jgi:hypothetical protein
MGATPPPTDPNAKVDPETGQPDLTRAKRVVLRATLTVAVLMFLSLMLARLRWDSLPFMGETNEPAIVPAGAPSGNGYWQVNETGYGPITFDDSVDVTEPHVGSYFQAKKDARGCWSIDFPFSPVGAEALTDGRVVTGVRVTSGKVETAQHIRIGSREKEVRQVYADSGYAVTERAVDSGSRELVAARPMSAYQLVFRIAGDRVASYRAGNTAELALGDRCR